MAGELVSFGIQKLWDLLHQEYSQFKGVEDQVTKLKTDLDNLKSFLKDVDAKIHKNERVRNCMEVIKEIIYDAEDILETFILKYNLRRSGGIKKRIRRFSSIFVDRRKIVSDMGGISKRISEVIFTMQSFGIVKQMIIDSSEYSHPLQERLRRGMRQEFAGECESDLVGLEANIEKLVGYLVEEDNVQIVSITGMGGLGKTTLARQAFNHDKVKSWKVLLTSRNMNVAGYGDTLIKFELECLTNQESWILFQKIAFPRKDTSDLEIDEEMEKMGKQMVKYCGGLPLAVRVLGGLLAEKYTPVDWKRLSDNIGSHIMGGRTNFDEGNNTSLNQVLSLSFVELPSHLKYCFLYLAHFPEDYEIHTERLSYYWAADGILKPRHYDGETIVDVGESYIEELVRRNMVISKRDVATLRFETCHMHDMMREICLSKAKKENFLHFLGNHSQITHSRRFVSQMPTTLDVKRDINNPKVRSLVVVLDNSWLENWKLKSLSFTRLQLLRVLHIPDARFEGGKLPSSIGELIHLKYLNLESAKVDKIPYSLGNLKLLIYLNINLWSNLAFVPNVLMGMKDLRYLSLPVYMDEKTKLELSNLVDLETLISFSTENSNLEDLHGMTRLRTLHIRLTDGRNLETLSAVIGGLRHLENLDTNYGSKKIKEGEGSVLDFINFKQLSLKIYGLSSEELYIPSRLTSVTLDRCCWKEDPMPILEKLMHLKEVCLEFGSFLGKRMVCSGRGFPQLQTLEMRELKEWEEWIVEEGSMYLLHTLNIFNCEKLKELPDGLRFITSLKYLEIYSEGEKWKERLSEGGEDYYKVQHIPCVLT